MKENLGFAFMAAGLLAIAIAITEIPLQFPSQSHVHKIVKVQPANLELSTKEQVLVAAYRNGWTGAQWDCLVELIAIENPGWDPKRKNKHSTATGLFQVLRSASGIWFRDYSVADQASQGAKYIAHRFGNPCKALAFHYLHGWY